MVAPNLIHPVPVVIEQIDKSETLFDDDAQEPIGRPEYNQVRISAQVKWKSIDDPEWMWSGRREGWNGYLLFLRSTLVARGVTINKGDLITSIGHRTCRVFVESFEDAGHYPDIGGNGLMLAFFSDRSPAEPQEI